MSWRDYMIQISDETNLNMEDAEAERERDER